MSDREVGGCSVAAARGLVSGRKKLLNSSVATAASVFSGAAAEGEKSINAQVKARRPHVVLVAFPKDQPSAAFSRSAFDVISLSHSADIQEMKQRFQQLPAAPDEAAATAARARAAGAGAAAKERTVDTAAAPAERPLLNNPAAVSAASKQPGAAASGEAGGRDRKKSRSTTRTEDDEGKAVSHIKALQGNLDPQILYASNDIIREETIKMKERFGVGRHIANLGHGMEPLMLPEHAAAFIDAVKKASARLLQQRRK